MNIFDILKYAKVAWSDKNQVETLVAQAKVMEGPKPSWETGEFWFGMVLPVLGGMLGSASALAAGSVVAPYLVMATAVVALGTYLGRTWLKGKHLTVSQSLDLSNPDVMAQITDVIKNVTATVNAVKDAKTGNYATAQTLSETLAAAVK